MWICTFGRVMTFYFAAGREKAIQQRGRHAVDGDADRRSGTERSGMFDKTLDVGKEVEQGFLRIVHSLADHGDAPAIQRSFLDGIWAWHEDKRGRAVLFVARSVPSLPEAVQQQPDVHVGHAVANEQYGPSKSVGAELDIKWGVE